MIGVFEMPVSLIMSFLSYEIFSEIELTLITETDASVSTRNNKFLCDVFVFKET